MCEYTFSHARQLEHKGYRLLNAWWTQFKYKNILSNYIFSHTKWTCEYKLYIHLPRNSGTHNNSRVAALYLPLTTPAHSTGVKTSFMMAFFSINVRRTFHLMEPRVIISLYFSLSLRQSLVRFPLAKNFFSSLLFVYFISLMAMAAHARKNKWHSLKATVLNNRGWLLSGK